MVFSLFPGVTGMVSKGGSLKEKGGRERNGWCLEWFKKGKREFE
jgi:hypothetical protein